MTATNARAKSPADLTLFQSYVAAMKSAERKGDWNKARGFANAAMAMVLTRKVWFVN